MPIAIVLDRCASVLIVSVTNYIDVGREGLGLMPFATFFLLCTHAPIPCLRILTITQR